MKTYTFSVGNSTRGPVGFCADVQAESPAEAVKILRDSLPEMVEIPTFHDGEIRPQADNIRVYFNEDAITEKDIEDVR